MKWVKRILKYVGIFLAVVIVLVGSLMFVVARRSVIPDNLNMTSSDMSGMDMSNMPDMAMGTPSANATSITSLVAPDNTNAPVKSFTLTAQPGKLDLGNGKTLDTYTFNGTIPGPELRVRQGDMVAVTLINKLPVSTTIHWHGISVPNAEDGVAGLTQDAVKPGASYTYRFIANEVGTYWYHSHQDTSTQLPLGLYGAIIIEPKNPPVHYDRDYSVFLHEWGAQSHDGVQGFFVCHATCAETLSMNDKLDKALFAAKPGDTVRVRIANSGEEIHYPALVGVPFKVIALDGHDLNEPTDLNNKFLSVGPAQRYDISFVVPASGSVALIDGDDRAEPVGQHPMAVFGDGSSTLSYPTNATPFDFTTYGTPASAKITLNSHFDAQYNMVLGTKPGFYNGNMTLTFPINDKTYPNIPSISIKPGDVVKIHMSNNGTFPIPHAMHIHGHYFTVLAHNGKPLSGSPVYQDTAYIEQGETYDVAFLANNPGLWMLHCHMVEHDAHGMDMMVNYPDISTPFTIGMASGNNPF